MWLNFRESNPADPESVKLARRLEVYYIQQWIKQARSLANI
jgi:hypothetical protein